jgi:predicted DNA-binding transcriptional regulator YafY
MAHWRLVDPYGLVYKGLSRKQVRTGVWYLVGFCHVCQSTQTFRVSYIENMHTCEAQIAAEHNFDLYAYWRETQKQWEEQTSSIEMVLRILPSAKHTLHGEYVVLREERDGSVIVRIVLESVEAAVSYVLALGAYVVVLTPAEVRDAVAMTAQTIVTLYE